MMDGSIVRAHQHASGGKGEQAIGRSRGGHSTKIHAKVDAYGRPLDFVLTGGHEHEICQAETLLRGTVCEYLLADKGYDSDAFREELRNRGIEAVIPSRRNRKKQLEHDKHIYKERNQIERFFNRLKQYRRIATRYDKLSSMYMGALMLVSIFLWIKL